MLPPHNRSLSALAAEEGISEATLYNWRRDARGKGRLLPDGATGPAGWSAADKRGPRAEAGSLGPCPLLHLRHQTSCANRCLSALVGL